MSDNKCNACGQPMPATPEPGGVTVEALRTLQHRCVGYSRDRLEWHVWEMLEALRPLAVLAEQSPVPLAGLVEEAEYKHRIVESGFECRVDTHHNGSYSAWVRKSEEENWTFRGSLRQAAEWAEAQAAPEPRRSKPVGEMGGNEVTELYTALGVVMPTVGVTGYADRAQVCRGYAIAKGIYDGPTDTILLPEEAPAT